MTQQVADSKEKRTTLTLTIRATNGATWETTDFKGNQKVGHVARKAVDHFISEGVMADGDYALALIVEGDEPRLLDDAAKLDDVGVTDHATLALVARDPQVDG